MKVYCKTEGEKNNNNTPSLNLRLWRLEIQWTNLHIMTSLFSFFLGHYMTFTRLFIPFLIVCRFTYADMNEAIPSFDH